VVAQLYKMSRLHRYVTAELSWFFILIVFWCFWDLTQKWDTVSTKSPIGLSADYNGSSSGLLTMHAVSILFPEKQTEHKRVTTQEKNIDLFRFFAMTICNFLMYACLLWGEQHSDINVYFILLFFIS